MRLADHILPFGGFSLLAIGHNLMPLPEICYNESIPEQNAEALLSVFSIESLAAREVRIADLFSENQSLIGNTRWRRKKKTQRIFGIRRNNS
jgi:hypothetical protein